MTVATGDILVYIDADCRAPVMLLERMERRFLNDPRVVAITGPYRFYDWDWIGVAGARLYDYTLAPLAQFTAHYVLRIGALLYGANFAVRRTALEAIGGFDTSIEFHGRDRLVDMVDLWEAANRDDLFSVTSLKHFPYIANSDFHRPKHLYSWKTLVRRRKDWPSLKTALCDNVNLAITLYRGESWTASRRSSRG